MIVALHRAFRLRKNSEFQRVRQQGRHLVSRLLILTWVPNERDALRVGFVVSKRISKHAVVRNYTKRRLSEAIRPLLPELPGGWDIVLSARSPVVEADLRTLKQDIVTLLQKARLLAPDRKVEAEESGLCS